MCGRGRGSEAGSGRGSRSRRRRCRGKLPRWSPGGLLETFTGLEFVEDGAGEQVAHLRRTRVWPARAWAWRSPRPTRKGRFRIRRTFCALLRWVDQSSHGFLRGGVKSGDAVLLQRVKSGRSIVHGMRQPWLIGRNPHAPRGGVGMFGDPTNKVRG